MAKPHDIIELARRSDVDPYALHVPYADSVAGLETQHQIAQHDTSALIQQIAVSDENIVGSVAHDAKLAMNPHERSASGGTIQDRAYSTTDFEALTADNTSTFINNADNSIVDDDIKKKEDEYKHLLENAAGVIGQVRPDYSSAYAYHVDLSKVEFRKAYGDDHIEGGCHHVFNGVAENHIDYTDGVATAHYVTDGNETVQELTEDAIASGEMIATGDLANNETLCDVDPNSEVCAATPFQFTP